MWVLGDEPRSPGRVAVLLTTEPALQPPGLTLNPNIYSYFFPLDFMRSQQLNINPCFVLLGRHPTTSCMDNYKVPHLQNVILKFAFFIQNCFRGKAIISMPALHTAERGPLVSFLQLNVGKSHQPYTIPLYVPSGTILYW